MRTNGPDGVQKSARSTKTAEPYSVTGPADPTGATGQTEDDGHLWLKEPAEDTWYMVATGISRPGCISHN